MEISNAYNKALELEGLLLLLRSEKIDRLKIELIFTRLFEKISEIDEELDALNRQFMLEAESETEVATVVDPAPEALPENDTEPAEDESESKVEGVPEFESESEHEYEYESESEVSPIVSPEECTEEENAEEQSTEEAIADNALFEESADADVEEKSQASEAHINITIEETGVDVNQSAFAQKANGDIRKVFTLNDNYKFRRQLFDNSQERYAQALAEIEGMNSTYEAEDYICKTLRLDKDNADVKDFIKIISAYFMGK